MADDVEELLKRAMKSLDAETPSGYFDALPGRTLLRLETSMQTTTGGGIERPGGSPPTANTTRDDAALAAGTAPTEREDDSGLHDIRDLAQSAKMRISQKRITTNPPLDDDVLASSSAGWKAVALPEPAKMVSLPELDERPSARELAAKDKAARKEARAKPAPLATATPVAVAREPSPRPAARASHASRQRRTVALVGVGLAAAAGAVLFVATRNGDDQTRAPSATPIPRGPVAAPAPTPVKPSVTPLADDKVARAPAIAAGSAAPTREDSAAATPAPPPLDEATPVTAKSGKAAPAKPTAVKPQAKGKQPGKTADDGKQIGKASDVEPAKPEKKPATTKKGKGSDGDQSFDDLLKEAGVEQKKDVKPKLDKTQLSGDDFKRGMAAIAARAQACYKGTQGTASVKITIAPSGKVAKVSVGGQFTGKPEADCVASAVKAAQFPPWDGPSQSFGYSYLLSE